MPKSVRNGTATAARRFSRAFSYLRWGIKTPTSLQVLWDDNANNETQYEFHWVGSYLGTTIPDQHVFLPAGSTSYTLYNLPTGSWWYVYVYACNSVCVLSVPTHIDGYTLMAPLPPSSAAISIVNSYYLHVSWSHPTSDETYFEVWRQLYDGNFYYAGQSLVAYPGAGSTEFTDFYVPEAYRIRYIVKACNAAGCSSPAGTALNMTVPTNPSWSGPFYEYRNAGYVPLSWSSTINEVWYGLEWWDPLYNYGVYNPGANVTSHTLYLSRNGWHNFVLEACNYYWCSAQAGKWILISNGVGQPTDTDRPPAGRPLLGVRAAPNPTPPPAVLEGPSHESFAGRSVSSPPPLPERRPPALAPLATIGEATRALGTPPAIPTRPEDTSRSAATPNSGRVTTTPPATAQPQRRATARVAGDAVRVIDRIPSAAPRPMRPAPPKAARILPKPPAATVSNARPNPSPTSTPLPSRRPPATPIPISTPTPVPVRRQ